MWYTFQQSFQKPRYCIIPLAKNDSIINNNNIKNGYIVKIELSPFVNLYFLRIIDIVQITIEKNWLESISNRSILVDHGSWTPFRYFSHLFTKSVLIGPMLTWSIIGVFEMDLWGEFHKWANAFPMQSTREREGVKWESIQWTNLNPINYLDDSCSTSKFTKKNLAILFYINISKIKNETSYGI